MPEHLAPGKKNHGDEPVRIVYHAGERTFARLFNESSLEEVKNVVRRKLGLAKSTAVVLKQIKSGKLLDLEDDDDFQAFEAFLLSSPSMDVEIEVTVGGSQGTVSPPVAAQFREPQSERVPSAMEPVGASTSKPTEKQPPKPVEASTSTAKTPKRKRAVPSGDVATSGAPKSTEEPSQKKKKKDEAKKTVGPSATPAASTSTVKPPRTEVQTSTAEPVKEKRKREKKVKELQPAPVVDLHAKKASDDRLTPDFLTLSTVTMAQHALAILEQNDQWNWPDMKRIQELGHQGRQLVAITHKLLYYLIVESQKFSGDVLEHFWKQLGTCDEKLKENIESLKGEDFVSAGKTFDVLFRGSDPKTVDFEPVLEMAAEFFTHLGIAFMNPGGRKSGTSTEFSVSEIVNEETDKLLEQVKEKGGFGKRNQETLKALSFRRDGEFCLLTGAQFMPYDLRGFIPDLAHIIPNSAHGKSDTLKCIAMFTGADARDVIMDHLNKPGNVMNMEYNAHSSYDRFMWGIEAKEEGRGVKYFFRTVPALAKAPWITLKDGDEIRFGTGPKPEKIDRPIPILCNLQLAVARVMRMSGAADIISEWMDRADDEFEGWDGLFIASEECCHIVDAKLFLTGRAVVA